MYRSFFIFSFLANILGCSVAASHSSSISKCLFLHSTEAQPTYRNELSPLSAHLFDDRISIQSDDILICELQSAGYPVDLVWLYPFHLQKLIFIEQSALGTKLNLVDIDKCEIIESQETVN